MPQQIWRLEWVLPWALAIITPWIMILIKPSLDHQLVVSDLAHSLLEKNFLTGPPVNKTYGALSHMSKSVLDSPD